MALIPTTILTGFLGAGKTTLLKHILQENHGIKVAVIENEFGPENIDTEILIHDSKENIVEMNNGCICCTVRGDLIVALSSLAQRRLAGQLQFDRVIIETTGLANPGPVAQTFFIDEEIGAHFMLDGVITVVDACHAMQQLDQHPEAQRQVGFADKLLLSKTDLLPPQQLSILKSRLSRINPRATVSIVDFGQISIKEVVGIKGFNLNDILEIDPDFLAAEEHPCEADCEHEHDHQHHHHHHDHHDHHDGHHHNHHSPQHSDEIAAFAFKTTRAFDTAKLDEFMGSLIQVYGTRMLRYKGVLWMAGADRKVVFQGVFQLMGSDLGGKWPNASERESKMVFIGQNLPKDIFIQGLQQCLV
jgi:G3E family GTPase